LIKYLGEGNDVSNFSPSSSVPQPLVLRVMVGSDIFMAFGRYGWRIFGLAA
jgi:hypothetical protein